MEQSPKFFLKSSTIIGGIMLLIAFVAPYLGYDFTPDDTEQIKSLLTQLLEHADAILNTVGLLLVFFGRAKKNIAPLTLKLGDTK